MKFTVKLWGDAAVNVEIEDGVAAIDGKVLEDKAFSHIVEYGFRQIIRDAGAISAADAAKPDADEKRNSLAQKKIDTLVSGKLRAGAVGQRLTPVERVSRSIAEREVRAAIQAKGLAVKSADIGKYVTKLLERDKARLAELAQKELAEATARVEGFDLEALGL
jgi:hypothetical protein